MSDPRRTDSIGDDPIGTNQSGTARINLGEALRALPLAAPRPDAWPALAARLAPPAARRRRRYALPLALAAACMLAIGVTVALRKAPQAPGAPTVAATVAPDRASSVANSTNVANMTNAANSQDQASTDAQLIAMQSRSQALERWLRETGRAASPLPGQDLAAAAEIENLIGLVDVELAASAQTNTLPLWQHRVALLEDLTTLRYSNYRLSEATLADASNRIN